MLKDLLSVVRQHSVVCRLGVNLEEAAGGDLDFVLKCCPLSLDSFEPELPVRFASALDKKVLRQLQADPHVNVIVPANKDSRISDLLRMQACVEECNGDFQGWAGRPGWNMGKEAKDFPALSSGWLNNMVIGGMWSVATVKVLFGVDGKNRPGFKYDVEYIAGGFARMQVG